MKPVTAAALLCLLVPSACNQASNDLCHQLASLDAEFQGNVGPPLTGIGARLDAGQIRYRIIDAQTIWPDTVMPSYYRTDGLRQVGEAYKGAPALNAQEIEDLVAFLETQTD